MNFPLCDSSVWGDLHYCYSEARFFLLKKVNWLFVFNWIWIWFLSSVYKMLSQSVFLGTGESHLLVLLSALGIEKLLSWTKCLCLVCLMSFTKWVSEAHVGKKLIFSAFMLFTFVWFPLKGTGEDITNYLRHPQFSCSILQYLLNGFCFLLYCFFYWSPFYSSWKARKLDSWYYHATVYHRRSRSKTWTGREDRWNTIMSVFPAPLGLFKVSEKCSSW